MLSLSSGTNAYANIVMGKVNNEAVYIVPLQDGRDTLALIDSQTAEITTLWEAIAKKDTQIDKLIEVAETTNTKRLKAEADYKREKKKHWGIGVFGGVNYTGEAVVGFGITYNFMRF